LKIYVISVYCSADAIRLEVVSKPLIALKSKAQVDEKAEHIQ
jgi:hypothetical protein